MKTIEESAYDTSCNFEHDKLPKEYWEFVSFEKEKSHIEGAEFAQRWISIEEEMPEKLATDCNQSNGNTLTFFENYIVKGYWNNEAKRNDVLMATYRPCSFCWFFRVHKDANTFDFIVTHWRPIEIK